MVEYAVASWIQSLNVGYTYSVNLFVDEMPLSPQTPDNLMTVVGTPDGWDRTGGVFSSSVAVSVRYGDPVDGARTMAVLARLLPDLVAVSPHLEDTVSGLNVVYHLNTVGLAGGGQLAGVDGMGRYTVRLPVRLSYQVVDWGGVQLPATVQ